MQFFISNTQFAICNIRICNRAGGHGHGRGHEHGHGHGYGGIGACE